jgi:hypothetical protein
MNTIFGRVTRAQIPEQMGEIASVPLTASAGHAHRRGARDSATRGHLCSAGPARQVARHRIATPIGKF